VVRRFCLQHQSRDFPSDSEIMSFLMQANCPLVPS
jgi:hypothetical protein